MLARSLPGLPEAALAQVAVKRTCPDCGGVGEEAGAQATLCSICGGRGHVATRFRNAPGDLSCPGSQRAPPLRVAWGQTQRLARGLAFASSLSVSLCACLCMLVVLAHSVTKRLW